MSHRGALEHLEARKRPGLATGPLYVWAHRTLRVLGSRLADALRAHDAALVIRVRAGVEVAVTGVERHAIGHGLRTEELLPRPRGGVVHDVEAHRVAQLAAVGEPHEHRVAGAQLLEIPED